METTLRILYTYSIIRALIHKKQIFYKTEQYLINNGYDYDQ